MGAPGAFDFGPLNFGDLWRDLSQSVGILELLVFCVGWRGWRGLGWTEVVVRGSPELRCFKPCFGSWSVTWVDLQKLMAASEITSPCWVWWQVGTSFWPTRQDQQTLLDFSCQKGINVYNVWTELKFFLINSYFMQLSDSRELNQFNVLQLGIKHGKTNTDPPI